MPINSLVGRLVLSFGLVSGWFSPVLAETLKIGVIAPLTGGGAPWGIAAAQAVKMVAAEANAAGGLDVAGKKYQVEAIAYDDQYKAADAVAGYNRLVNQDGVKFIILATSPSTLALAPNAEDDKVLLLTTAGVEKAVDPKSKYIFRVVSILRDYVPATVSWVKDNVPGRRVVIINPNDESGWYSTEVSKESYRKYGFAVLNSELFERSQKDFQPMLTRILGLKPDIIELASCPPATTGLIVRQARELGYRGLFVKDAGAATKEILETAGKEAAEGVISLHYADPYNEGFKRVAAEYRRAIGQAPDDLIIAFYDGAEVLLRAIQKAGDVNDTAKVSAAFGQVLPMKSVLGDDMDLGGRGGPGDPNQIMKYSYISVIRNGEPVMVGKVK